MNTRIVIALLAFLGFCGSVCAADEIVAGEAPLVLAQVEGVCEAGCRYVDGILVCDQPCEDTGTYEGGDSGSDRDWDATGAIVMIALYAVVFGIILVMGGGI